MNGNYILEPIIDSDGTRRERERKAVNRIVGRIWGSEAVVSHRDDGSPFIAGVQCHISVSHSRHYAAIAWDVLPGIGIDIEEPRIAQLEKVADRFLATGERQAWSARLLEAWTLKEAAFKALRNGPADLREYILPTDESDKIIKVKGKNIEILSCGFVRPGLCLSLVRAVDSIQNHF